MTANNFITGDKFAASIKLIPPYSLLSYGVQHNKRMRLLICTRTAKVEPWFVNYGCVPGLYYDLNFVVTTAFHKPTRTHFIAGLLAVIVTQQQTLTIYL